MKRWLLTSLVLLHAISGIAQQFQIKNYNTSNGLLHATVYRIFQDRQGYMWFCTDAGICSFDGKSFTSNLSPNDSDFFSSVLSVSEDESGHKIAATYHHGLIELGDTSNKSYAITQGRYPPLSLYAAQFKNHIWLIGRDSVQILYKLSGHTIVHYPVHDATGRNVQFNKLTKYDDKILLASGNGVYIIRDSTLSPLFPSFHDDVVDVKVDHAGHYWIALKHKLIEADGKGILKEYDIGAGRSVGNILCDSHNEIWISLYGEGVLLLKDGIIKDITRSLPIPNMNINDLFEDSEGGIWLATYNNGVYLIPSMDILAYPFDEVDNTFCTALSQLDSNSQLVCSIGKVGICKNGLITSLKVSSLERNEYVYFAKHIGNYIYIGTPYKLIVKQDNYPGGERVLQLIHNSGAVTIYKDGTGRLLLGGFESSYIISDDHQELHATPFLANTKRCNAILQDHSGNFWLGATTGLIFYNGTSHKMLPDSLGPMIHHVLYLYEDSYNRIWAATAGGLLCFENQKMRIFKTANGLLSNKCNIVTEDNHILWLGTVKGLNYIDLQTLGVKTYNQSFTNTEINTLLCDNNHTLYVGTTENLFSIKTTIPTKQYTLPPVYITSVKTATSRIIKPLAISLPYNENKIIIDFICLNFKNPNEIEYRYMVKNLDDKWHTTTNTTIELAGLPSGDYVFVLNARKRNEPWGSDVTMPIKIATPFWRKLWFILLVSCTAISSIYLITRKLTQKTELKKREHLLLLNKVTYLKQQALSALINPHFIFNCMNSIQHFMNRKDTDKANGYLADFAHLIRLTMENAQDAFIILDKEIKRLALYLSLEQLRFGNELTYTITVDNHLNIISVFIPNMIIQPFVENAIWHGIMPNEGKGHISVAFKKLNSSQLQIVISDNGVGIKNSSKQAADDKKQHFGIKLTEERLELLKQLSHDNYEIIIAENNGSEGGTMVSITVPIMTKGAHLDKLSE